MYLKNKIIHILPHSPSAPGGSQDFFQTTGCGPAYEATSDDINPTLGSTNPEDYKYFQKIDHYPYWVGFFQNDWHVQVAIETQKRTNKYNTESRTIIIIGKQAISSTN